MLTSVGGSPAISLHSQPVRRRSTVTHCLVCPSVICDSEVVGGKWWQAATAKNWRHTMKLFRPLLASAAVVMAAAYVPPHMELPAGWTDVAAATVRLVYVV